MKPTLDINKRIRLNEYKKPENSVSFKGVPVRALKAISSAMDNSKVLTSVSQSFDVEPTLNLIRKNIGSSADVLFSHIKGDDVINKSLLMEGETLAFKNKKPLRLLINGVLYPVVKLPFYILYGTINKLKKFKSFANSEWLKNFEKTSFYRATHSYIKKDDKLNALQGLMEIGSQKNVMGHAARQKAFLQNTAKTFDSKFGNYNAVHERALTRIVTGFIPAVFLANDAHNLSILCTNNKKEAQEEKDLRFKQESKRVLSNAYIQLITLGALSKFINKSKSWFIGVTAGTVLLTEVYSRLSTGKKIKFINSKEAKEINMKLQKNQQGENKGKVLSFTSNYSSSALNVDLSGVNKFIEDPKFNKFADILYSKNKKSDVKENKSLKTNSVVTFSSVLKYSAAVIAAGFSIRFMKKIPAVDKMFNSIAKSYNKIYTNITMKQNVIQKAELEKVIQKMSDCGFGTLAKSYKEAIIDYQKLLLMPKKINEEFIEHLNKTNDKSLVRQIISFASGKDEKALLKELKSEKIKYNIEVLKRYLRFSKEKDLLSRVNELTKDGKINYETLHNLFAKKENAKYKDILENAFELDDNTLKLGLLNKCKKALNKAGLSDIWKKLENETYAQMEQNGTYNLGKIKKPIIKDIIDFCIEPIKFVNFWATLPYKGLFKLKDAFKSVPNKATKDIDTVANAMKSLAKKVSMDNESFTDMFNEKIVKGFNTATMSKVANSELSAIAKMVSTVTTMSFLISDNYNMVMLKSNGENVEEAKMKGKERFVQEMSRFFWQQLFINLFNNTFSGTYNSSLLGASIVNSASTSIGEVCTRKAVGLPINAASKEEIIELERKNLSGDGIKSKFYRFMSKLTGKKILSERETKTKK